MSVNLLYFASLRDTLGCSAETLELPPGVSTVGQLRELLCSRGEAWLALVAGSSVRAAVNHELANASTPIAAGDEIAFFPPVTGG